MDRREFILALSAALAARPSSAASNAAVRLDSRARQSLRAIVDVLLPRTSTSGGLDTGVPQFVTLAVEQVLPRMLAQAVLDGLAALDEVCRARRSRAFADWPRAAQAELIAHLDFEVLGASIGPSARTAETASLIRFWMTLKQLCLCAHFTTREAVQAQLEFDPMPGRFDPDVAVTSASRVSYTDRTSVPYLMAIPP
jgi:hypothetical protein